MSGSNHARTEKILQAIDAAKAQRERNDTMRNSLLDAEDLLEQLHEQLLSERIHKEISEALTESNSALRRYETELSYSATTKKHPAPRYMADCSLEVPLSELTTEESTESQRAVTFGITSFTELRDQDTTGMRDFFERGLNTLHGASKLVEEAKIESDPWLPTMEPVVGLLRRLINVRGVGETLEPLMEQVDRLLTTDAELLNLHDQAVDEGNIAESEEVMTKRIVVLEGVTDLISEQFRLLDEEDQSLISKFSAEVEEVQNKAKSSLLALRSVAAARRKRLEDDLSSLQKESKRAQTDESIARGSYEKDVEKSNMLLEKNKQQQNSIWEQIHQLNSELVGLARERREEVDRRVKMVEREERRRVDMRHFTSFAEEHERLLMATVSTCQAQDMLGDAMEEVIAGGCGAISRKLRQLGKTVETMRVAALDQHLDTFTTQYDVAGELMYKNERRREELLRKMDLAKAQQEAAMESLNPVAREYAVRQVELDEKVKEVDLRIETLRMKAALYVEAFKPSEKALIVRNRVFEHPVKQVLEKNKERGRKLTEFHTLVLREGGPTAITEEERNREAHEIDSLRTALKKHPRRIKELPQLPAPNDTATVE